MSRTRWWNPRLGPVSLSVTLVVAHAVLREILSRYDVVSCVFAAGGHVPRWMLSCAGAFVVVRLSVFLLVPALLAWRLVTAAVRRIAPACPVSPETGRSRGHGEKGAL